MKKLSILVAPYAAVGPITACRGALSSLLARGHRVIFVITPPFKGQLSSLGYEEHVIQTEKPDGDSSNKPGEALAKSLYDSKVLGPFSPREKLEYFLQFCNSNGNYEEIGAFEHGLKLAIETYRPDLIYADCGVLWPSIFYSGIPFIRNVSMAPTSYLVEDDAEFPPSQSGNHFIIGTNVAFVVGMQFFIYKVLQVMAIEVSGNNSTY